MKWEEHEKYKLLLTAIRCFPGFRLDAAKVVERWTTEDGSAKPTQRAVRDRFNRIIANSKDLESLSDIRNGRDVQNGNSTIQLDQADIALTPPETEVKKSAVRKAISLKASKKPGIVAGQKRKRGHESDEDAASMDDTTSASESEIETPTKMPRKKLPRRSARKRVSVQDMDAADEGDSEGREEVAPLSASDSDEDYDYVLDKAHQKARMAGRK